MARKTKLKKVVHAVNKDIDVLTDELINEKSASEIEDLENFKKNHEENLAETLLNAD